MAQTTIQYGTGAQPGPVNFISVIGGSSGNLTNATVQIPVGGSAFELQGFWVLVQAAFQGAGRVRLYRSAAGRDLDAARVPGGAYAGGCGLAYDYVATTAETDLERPVLLTPIAAGGSIFARATVAATLSLTGFGSQGAAA